MRRVLWDAATGQQLSKTLLKKICITVDWVKVRGLGIVTTIEQNHNTHQVGAVISTVTIPPCCFINVTFMDKIGNPWHSIELFSIKMIEDKSLGIIAIGEFARKQADVGEWAAFLRCWRLLRAEISYPADASVLRMVPTMRNVASR